GRASLQTPQLPPVRRAPVDAQQWQAHSPPPAHETPCALSAPASPCPRERRAPPPPARARSVDPSSYSFPCTMRLIRSISVSEHRMPMAARSTVPSRRHPWYMLMHTTPHL